jgi:hypothetical protein
MAVNTAFILLNVLRIISVISLMLVIVTSIIVNVKGFPGLGQSNTIFQFLNRCVIALVAILLVFAEFEWPRAMFYWFPMLDEHHSWTSMGVMMTIMGSFILGYDNGIANVGVLGSQLYTFIIVPGWFMFIVGLTYFMAGSFGGPQLKHRRRIGRRLAFSSKGDTSLPAYVP